MARAADTSAGRSRGIPDIFREIPRSCATCRALWPHNVASTRKTPDEWRVSAGVGCYPHRLPWSQPGRTFTSLSCWHLRAGSDTMDWGLSTTRPPHVVFFNVLAEICVIPLPALRMPDEEAVKRAAIHGVGARANRGADSWAHSREISGEIEDYYRRCLHVLRVLRRRRGRRPAGVGG